MMGKIYTKADKVLIWLRPFPSEISEDSSEQGCSGSPESMGLILVGWFTLTVGRT